MKYIAISLASLAVILGGLYLTVDGEILLTGAIVMSIILAIIIAFSLGIWYAHKLIQLGANIAIEAQNNNDQWDTTKTEALAKFGNEILRLKGDSYPALPEQSDTFNSNFIIEGLDE